MGVKSDFGGPEPWWVDMLSCPHCHVVLESTVHGSPGERSLTCGNCRSTFTGILDSFDFTTHSSERDLERRYYEHVYSSRSCPRRKEFDPQYWSRRWADAHWPEFRLILDRLGDLSGKVVLCLGNGDSLKELYFLSLGARVIFSDLSMSGILSVRSKYDLGVLSGRAAFHAVDAYRIPFRDHSIDVVYGYEFVHHLADLDTFFHEVHRVLRPGGLCLFFDSGYSSIWQGAKRTFLWPLRQLSRSLYRRSPEDLRASDVGGYSESFLGDLASKHGFSASSFDRVMFFQYLGKRVIGTLFGWRLPPACYRIPSAIGRYMDRLLTDRLHFLQRNRIGLVFVFRE
jgi:SAM-dependent methyltransferase